jgi:hypothetical protein
MFNDTVDLYIIAGSVGSPVAVSLVNPEKTLAGQSVRQYNHGEGVFTTLYTGHQTSKENSPVLMDRVRHAVERKKPSTLDSTKEVKCSASLVIAAPRAQFTKAEVRGVVQALILSLIEMHNASFDGSTVEGLAALFQIEEDGSTPMGSTIERMLSGQT